MPGGQLRGNPGSIQLSNQGLDGGYRSGRYTELPEPETQPDWKSFRIGGNLAADRNFDSLLLRSVDNLFTYSDNRWMKRIGESGQRGAAPFGAQDILSEIVGSDATEVEVRQELIDE